MDHNVDGNPASRQRVQDGLTGSHWRRRLLVFRENPPATDNTAPAPGTVASNAGPAPIGLASPISPQTPASSGFAGFIPGRARPGDASSAVEPLNPELRERKRNEAIIAGEGGSFSVAPNPSANSDAPWYEYLARSNVRDYAGEIEQVAAEEGIDPDLIRAVMFVETTHGLYGGLGPLADALGKSDTILPMNVNVRSWGDNFGSRAQLNRPLDNIRAGARVLKSIIGNFQSPAPITTIGTLYNDSKATRVSDYGARVDAVYKSRPWERELDLVDTMVPLGMLPDR